MTPQQLKGWARRCAAARKRGHFTEKDIKDAKLWKSCAVGEQRRLHPKVILILNNFGDPNDDDLWALGCEFANEVSDNEIDGAERVLAKIKARADILVKRYVKKQAQHVP